MKFGQKLSQQQTVSKPAATKKRLLASIVAHLYAQGVTIMTQLASLPIFLYFVTAEQYGQWVMISALSFYLSLADGGMLVTAGNKMTMHQARGEKENVGQTYRTAKTITLVSFPILCAIIAALASFIDAGFMAQRQIKEAAFFLGVSALITFACGIFDASYRTFGKFARWTYIITTARIIEWGGSIIGLILGQGIYEAALGSLAGRITATGVIFILASRDVPDLKKYPGRASRDEAKYLFFTGGSHLAFPISNLISIQGTVLIAGALLGPVAAATFSTYRTVARILTQISNLVSRAASPEISRLYGEGKLAEVDKLSQKAHFVTLILTFAGCGVLALGGPTLISLWSHGKIDVDFTAFSILLVSTLITGFWQIPSLQLTATNRHRVFAGYVLFASIGTLTITTALASSIGLLAPPVGLLIGEACIWYGASTALKRLKPNSKKTSL